MCMHEKTVKVNGKVSDMVTFQDQQGRTCEGIVPSLLRIGGGDYLRFTFCTQCGKILGKFPIYDEHLEAIFGDDED